MYSLPVGQASLYLASLLTLASALTACSTSEETAEPAVGELGAECDLAQGGPCNEGLSCVEDESGEGVCAVSVGESCDPESDAVESGGCGASADCVDPVDGGADRIAPVGGSSGDGESEGGPVCLLKEASVCDPVASYCQSGFLCTETRTGENRCFGRVVLRGVISDSSDDSGIAGADISVFDEEGAEVGTGTVSGTDGAYELEVPVLRNGEDGTPIESLVSLKVTAEGYSSFPADGDEAPTIQTADTLRTDDVYYIESADADVELTAL